MKKVILFIIAISFYPFGCEAQTNPTPDACDTVFIDSPEWDAERETFNQMITRLTQENEDLAGEVQNLNSDVLALQGRVSIRDAEISTLKTSINNKDQTISELELALSEKADTIYLDKIVEIIKPDDIDEVIVSHCDSTKLTTWFHHGGVAGYPHDISFATSEYGFVRVTFNDSLTNEIKVQPQYTLKRIRNYENAKTYYEFIK